MVAAWSRLSREHRRAWGTVAGVIIAGSVIKVSVRCLLACLCHQLAAKASLSIRENPRAPRKLMARGGQC